MVSLVFGILVMFVRSPEKREVDKPCYMRKLVHPVVLRSIFWGAIPISLLVTIIAYARIYRKISQMLKFKDKNRSVLKALVTIMQSTHKSSTIGRAKMRKMKEIKTTILMLVTIVFFVISWFPGIIALLLLVTAPDQIKAFHRDIVFILYSANSTFNPFLYAFHISSLRNRLLQIWNWCRCQRRKSRDIRLGSVVGSAIVNSTTNSKVCFNDFELYF